MNAKMNIPINIKITIKLRIYRNAKLNITHIDADRYDYDGLRKDQAQANDDQDQDEFRHQHYDRDLAHDAYNDN